MLSPGLFRLGALFEKNVDGLDAPAAPVVPPLGTALAADAAALAPATMAVAWGWGVSSVYSMGRMYV